MLESPGGLSSFHAWVHPLDQPVNSSEADAQALLVPMFSQDKIQLGSKTLSYTIFSLNKIVRSQEDSLSYLHGILISKVLF